MSWCENCTGTGKISCGTCWGGNRRPICPDCMGKKTDDNGKPCKRCNGFGRITPTSCPPCGNSFNCPVCSGKGEK